MVAVVLFARPASAEQLSRYQAEAELACLQGQPQRAKLCFQRLALADADQPAHRFNLALAEAQLGNRMRAWTLMKSLAEDTQDAFAPACHWLARQRLRAGYLSTEELQDVAETLLKIQSPSPETNSLLGQVYLAQGRLDEAETCLKQVAAYPEPLLILARVHALQGKNAEARLESGKAFRFFEERATVEPANVPYRVHWAEAAALLDQFKRAVEILEEGWRTARAPAYRLMLAQTYVQWSASSKLQPPALLGARLVLLQRAVLYDHGNTEALRRMLALTHADGPAISQAWDDLQRQLASDPAPAGIHLVLGLLSQARSRPLEAHQHLVAAVRGDARFAPVLNNLAWLELQSDSHTLSRGMQLIDAVLVHDAKNPHYRDTRGHLLYKLGRWSEARSDLETAAAVLPRDAARQRALAEALRH